MDNAYSYTAEATQLEIGVLGFGSMQHLPYSPDLVRFDFANFPVIKRQPKEVQRFDSLTELRRTTSAIVKKNDWSWYEDIFLQWVHRRRRCIGCESFNVNDVVILGLACSVDALVYLYNYYSVHVQVTFFYCLMIYLL